MQHKLTKGEITIHKLKGEHEWQRKGLSETCTICGIKRGIAVEPIWSEDRTVVFLPDPIATQDGLRELCTENFNLYNQPVKGVYVLPRGAEQLENDYMGEARFMHTKQDPNFANRHRGREGKAIYDITNLVTGDPITVFVVRDVAEVEHLINNRYNPIPLRMKKPFKITDDITWTYDES